MSQTITCCNCKAGRETIPFIGRRFYGFKTIDTCGCGMGEAYSYAIRDKIDIDKINKAIERFIQND